MAEPAATGSAAAGRRTFWPTVLLGVVGAGIAAISGSHGWVTLKSTAASVSGTPAGMLAPIKPPSDAPGVTALGLVALAGWGVVLVTRRRVRRGVAGLVAVASLAALASDVAQVGHVKGTVRAAYGAQADVVALGYTAWPWLALLGTALSLVAAVVAVRKAPAWPEMGAKYDAPTGHADRANAVPLEEQSSIDLWKSLDEGADPTIGPTHDSD